MTNTLPSTNFMSISGSPEGAVTEFLPMVHGDRSSSLEEFIHANADPMKPLGKLQLQVTADLTAACKALVSEHWNLGNAILQAAEKMSDAKREKLTYLRQCEEAGIPPNERELARLSAVEDAATAEHKRLMDMAKSIGRDRNSMERVAERTLAYIADDQRRTKTACKLASTVTLPSDVMAELEKVRSEIDASDADAESVRSAPGDLEEAKAAFTAKLGARIRPITLNEVGDGPYVPTTIKGEVDALGILLGVDSIFEAVARPALEELARKTEAAGKTYTAAARKAALADIRARRLELSRVEVACIRHLRSKGMRLVYRADTDPRAILGISGPPPSKLR